MRFVALSCSTFWWFDANWDFSVPPPMVGYSGHGDGSSWCGLDNRVWGSHLYYTISEQYNLINSQRKHTLAPGRPLALTKYAVMNMKPKLAQLHHPAHHRFPVWWTGDNVPLEGSIESMVDSGVHGFMPYVSSIYSCACCCFAIRIHMLHPYLECA